MQKALIICILIWWLHLGIRSHNLMAQPVFTDEYSHISRAAVIYDFEQHPAVNSRGKFLFYFLPAIFDLKQSASALFLSRLSVALASLLTSALIFRLSQFALKSIPAGLFAISFYALLPYAFFFERMVLADPFAGLVATALVWSALRFAQGPSTRQALILGSLMAFTPAAKLTLSFVAIIPAFAILLLGDIRSWRDLMGRYFKPSLLAIGVTVFWWAWVILPAWLQYGEVDYIFFDDWLIDPEVSSSGSKWSAWWEKMEHLASLPMTFFLIAASLWGLWQAPRKMGIIGIWLILAWFPTFFIVAPNAFQSRYLMAGLPAVAVLAGCGAVYLFPKRQLLLWGFLGLWALAFALPFAQTAATQPEKLALASQDQKDYLSGYYNAYGVLEAMQFLEERGKAQQQSLYAISHTHYCLPDLYQIEWVRAVCRKYPESDDLLPSDWEELALRPLQEGQSVYLISDYGYQSPPLKAELLASFPKPQSAVVVYVWILSN